MMTDTISYFLDSEWTCPLNFWCSNKGVSVITHTVLYLSYMLGISEIILENRFGTGYDSATLSTLGQASLIRSCCRARQIVLFHFTNGKKIFELPDALRSYCRGALFEELQQQYKQCYYSWDFVNLMTDRILEALPETMSVMGIPHGDILTDILFDWPRQNKTSLLALSHQYHNKKFSFPYECFFPKPSTIENALPHILDNDESLYNAPPIKMAISTENTNLDSTEALKSFSPLSPPPEKWMLPNVFYIDRPFSPTYIPVYGECQINYIDSDNIPGFVIAQICTCASASRIVKLFYDDRSHKNISIFQDLPYVELFNVERLKSEKSLVDAQIIVEIMRDAYCNASTHSVLYSSDSDFYTLSQPLSQAGIPFSVVGLEENFSETYIEQLSKWAKCYVLSDSAIVPQVDTVLIKQILTQQITRLPLASLSVSGLSQTILNAIADAPFQALMSQDISSTIRNLLKNARIEVAGDFLYFKFEN